MTDAPFGHALVALARRRPEVVALSADLSKYTDVVVIDPRDATEIAQVVEAVAEYQGPVYVRLLRASVPVVLNPASYKFTIGKATILKDGSDMGFVSTGFMTERALDAATELAKRGVKAGVLHVQ